MKPYESPDVIEIGRTEDVVLGDKPVNEYENSAEPFWRPEASFLDTDE